MIIPATERIVTRDAGVTVDVRALDDILAVQDSMLDDLTPAQRAVY